MLVALDEALQAAGRGEVPVGAALLDAGGVLLARSGNRILQLRDPTAHAEILALREAALRTGNERLTGSTLYVTLEPCAMCAGAISLARIARLVFAAEDSKGGAVFHGPRFFTQTTCHHRPQVEQMCDQAETAGGLLKEFFRGRRS